MSGQGSIFTGAGGSGIYACQGSIINADGADASGAAASGLFAQRAGIINADSAISTGAAEHGVYAWDKSLINFKGDQQRLRRRAYQEESGPIILAALTDGGDVASAREQAAAIKAQIRARYPYPEEG